jgi:peptide/nickel transport system ATP-binding protein
MTSLLEVRDLKKHFALHGGVLGTTTGFVYAVDGVSFEIARGETLSLVGESGCGKSTVGKTILRLIPPTAGEVWLDGQRIDNLPVSRLRRLRRRIQVVFQDPFSSLNPRQRVRDMLAEPIVNFGLAANRSELDDRVAALLDKVQLPRDAMGRHPHEFSGGQRQRIGIARALAPEPDLIICDEAVSALDVSIQAQVINLLDDLQDDFGLSYVFIAHDLSVVRHVSDRIAVMYLGKIVELSPARELYSKPIHPYTEALLAAIPIPDPEENRARERVVVGGEPPNPVDPPPGCRFHTRCQYATDVCKEVEPPLAEYPGGHLAACHHPRSLEQDDLEKVSRSPLSPLSSAGLLPNGKESPVPQIEANGAGGGLRGRLKRIVPV